MLKFIFQKRYKLESTQVYELILDKPYIFKWRDNDEFYCLEREQVGRIKLIRLISGDIYFRCFFPVHVFMPFCDLPFMNPSFIPLQFRDECVEYKKRVGKWPVINIIEGD